MDLHDFVSSEDAQGVAKWIGVGVSSILAFLGLERWYMSRKQRAAEEAAKARADLDIRFAHKAELDEVEACHDRISRHRKANEQHVEMLKQAVDELKEANERHQRIEEKLFDRVDANAKEATDRHLQLMGMLTYGKIPKFSDVLPISNPNKDGGSTP